MKKMLAVLSAALLCLSLSSCKKGADGEGESTVPATAGTTGAQLTTTTCKEEADVKYTDVNEKYVTTEELNIRRGPGTEFEKITVLPKGKSVLVLCSGDNGWSRVKLEDAIGYAKTEYLEKETTTAPTTTQPPTIVTSSLSNGLQVKTVNGVTYVDGILIANKTYSLPEDFNPGGLTDECMDAFNKMSAAAAQEGLDIYVASGFRSYSTQEGLYDSYVEQDGQEAADTYSARPGYSEHQTGLAIDLNSVTDDFADTEEGEWTAANCWKYGFILRYPKGKEAKTGYVYEPWHFRYVGTETAKKIYESGLCLEEYLGITSQYK